MKLQTNSTSSDKRLRYAIYARYSSEMQTDLSLEGQERTCRQAIADRGGVVVAVYTDSARTGWSLDREGFIELQKAAEKGKFDAIMFWKFDRLARDHNHTVMIKMLLRHEYGLKLHCVEGFSEDDDDSPFSALMEQMLAVWSAFYSKNLSNETKRGKRQRAINGEFNGSIAPLGYALVTTNQATAERPAGLHVEPRAAAIVRRAFKLYSTGQYSHSEIAEWMNQRPYIKKLKAGQQPINREMVRDMLQNRVHTGRVRHTDTIYKGTLGERRMSNRHRSEWYEGKHPAIISDELFDQCQAVRENAAYHHKKTTKVRTYVLHDRVYCARCTARKPVGLDDDNCGRMRPYYQGKDEVEYYRCTAIERGYTKCGQKHARVREIDQQIVEILATLTLPTNFKERIETAVRGKIEHDAAFRRMAEVQEIVKRIDFSWEQGFLEKEAYFEKRRQLQQEMESLRPIDYDELMQAADLLQNFRAYWNQCDQVENPKEARKQLLAKIVERVFVYGDQILAIVLYGDFAVLLGENKIAPSEVESAIQASLVDEGIIPVSLPSGSGDDGVRIRPCTIFVLFLRVNKRGDF